MSKVINTGLLILMTGCFAVNTAAAQSQWTPEQKAVWDTETKLSDLMVKGDFQSFKDYVDDSYQSWPMKSEVPIPKAVKEKEIAYNISLGIKVDFYAAIPLVIWVNGDYAYADYYYDIVFESKEGKKTREHGRWMDVLLKKDGKWVIVGDCGGADPAHK